MKINLYEMNFFFLLLSALDYKLPLSQVLTVSKHKKLAKIPVVTKEKTYSL